MTAVLCCPMPSGAGDDKCGSDLWYRWTMMAPAYCADITAPGRPTPDPDDAWSGDWAVECEQGHVILVPAELSGHDCDGSEGCAVCADQDTDEALRTIRYSDLLRLRDTIRRLGPVVDLAGVAQIVTPGAVMIVDESRLLPVREVAPGVVQIGHTRSITADYNQGGTIGKADQ